MTSLCVRVLPTLLLNAARDYNATYLARAEYSINRKEKVTEDFDRFHIWKNTQWVKPQCNRVDVLPFVPNTQEVNDLIASSGPKMSVFCLLLKETGCRFGEGFSLRWQDIDTERSHVTITPLKAKKEKEAILLIESVEVQEVT